MYRSPISPAIITRLSKILAGSSDDSPGGQTAAPLHFQELDGGSINRAFRLTGHQQQWFCKINDARRYPDLFATEARGLDLLRQTGTLIVPTVLDCFVVEETQVLLLEWIPPASPAKTFWRDFGQQLAQLHRCRPDKPLQVHNAPAGQFAAEPGQTPGQYGLEFDNYMGALPQPNTPCPDWTRFFIQRRLEPQVRLARDGGLLAPSAIRQFEKLYARLDDIFENEPPSLLHGDLWSGNFLCDIHQKPVLIDPAVYYGHRSMDLAMTTLFGGFDHSFYEAYHGNYPLPPNYREQWEICNLYPLLVHLNLFGRPASPPDPPSPGSFSVTSNGPNASPDAPSPPSSSTTSESPSTSSDNPSPPSPSITPEGPGTSSEGPIPPSSSITSEGLGYRRNILHTIQRF